MAYDTVESRLALASGDPEFNAICRHMNSDCWDTSRPQKSALLLRDIVEKMSLPPPSPHPQITRQVIHYTTRPEPATGKTHQHRILIFSPVSTPVTPPSTPPMHPSSPRPTCPTGSAPLLVFFHPGGGCAGSPEASASFAQNLALSSRVVVAVPYYRLASESSFETHYADAWDAVRHLARVGSTLSGGPNLCAGRGGGFIVGGASYGATLASLVALQARDEGLATPVTGTWLAAGNLIPRDRTAAVLSDEQRKLYVAQTQRECESPPLLSQRLSTCLALTRRDDQLSEFARPVNWRTARKGGAEDGVRGWKGFRDLPRTYLQACGRDHTRDDSLAYESILREDGVQTRLDVYPGCPHLFWDVFTDTQAAQRWERDTVAGLKWLLGRI